MQRTVDEETPLLAESTTKQSTPLPWPQFSILLVLQLAEPLTSNVISPFTPQLVRDLGVTQGVESRVGYYVGLLQSLFFVAEACTVLYWSRTSDQIGRKPVIMSGLLGLSLSMYCFGLSKTFWGLVLSRSMSGALNGNIGVMKSMVVEITDSTNISKAYAFMPLAWNTGGTLGPMIGGWLVQPVKRFPKVFGGNLFLQEYPYFLPCAVSATFSLIAFVVTFFFLNETLPCPIPMRRYFGISTLQPTVDKWSTSASNNKIAHSGNKQSKFESRLPIRSLFTPRVIIAAGNYASVSLVDISFRTIQPIFFSTPRHLGGLGLPPSTIGIILACFGLLNGSAQVLFFARVSNRWGPRNVFLWGLVLAIPALATFPCISYLSRTQGYTTTLWVIVGLQIVLSIGLCFCFGAVFIFIASASPNRASIGATNGISQMMVSVVRAIGPAAASSLFSLSLDKHYLGGFLVYYVLIALVGIALYIGSMLPRQVWTD
ncbi:Major facilitator-type transporter psiT2 [Psilocybe cubensis]|uniref:Major facilitator-type transporter psiT2 n=1 Tax=Psilocybe cubensis TaxID=181762 RepID=A0ACB8H1S6_PSICU|nr:Major facilitator-type transporter psiT2 [Psilocybe cubensis]KAH9481794.1 Major facilitator-type transporter psiT2 [Psilocybe cubensis]